MDAALDVFFPEGRPRERKGGRDLRKRAKFFRPFSLSFSLSRPPFYSIYAASLFSFSLFLSAAGKRGPQPRGWEDGRTDGGARQTREGKWGKTERMVVRAASLLFARAGLSKPCTERGRVEEGNEG